jgi:hypothetical protein
METYPFFTKKRDLLPIQGTLLKRQRQEADRYIAYYDMAGLHHSCRNTQIRGIRLTRSGRRMSSC